VFDFGGGTFDVSVLDRDAGLLEIRTSRGDTELGGDDIDRAFVAWVLDRLGRDRSRIENDPRAMTRLIEAVERAKIALSDRVEVRLFEPFLAGEGSDSVSLDLVVHREQFEQVARPFVDRALLSVEAALRDAKLRPRDLHRILLVGGSSRIPLVGARVADLLGRPVVCDDSADRAVALGATLLAGRAAGLDIEEVLVDITPHTLAVGAVTDVNLDDWNVGAPKPGDLGVVAVIPRDTVVPVERTRLVHTMIENQTAAELPVVQGEAPRVGGNTFLGEVVVKDLPPSPAHSPVEVRFRLDLSGVLDVTATHLPSGKAASVTIEHSPYRLSEQTRQRAQAQIEALRDASGPSGAADSPPADERASEAELALAQALLARAERALSTPRHSDDQPAHEAAAVERVRTARADLAAAVTERGPDVGARSDALSDALLDLL
jgi:molecular chaperone DnaK